MFKLTKNYDGNRVKLEAREYSKEELVKLYGSEKTFNYCLKCTSLKDALVEIKEEPQSIKEKITDVVEEIMETVAGESSILQVMDNVETVDVVEEPGEAAVKYLVEKNIKNGRKIAFKEGDKLELDQLEGFDVESLLKEGFLIEIKVV